MSKSDQEKEMPDWEGVRPYLWFIARRLIGAYQANKTAEDLVQDTYLRAIEHRERFQGQSKGQWLAWLKTIMKNLLLNLIRDDGRHNPPDEKMVDVELEKSSCCLANLVPADQTSPTQHVVRDEKARLVAEALYQLPNTQREILYLQFFEDMKPQQIAARLGITAGSFDGQRTRAMLKLHKLLRRLEESNS